MLVEDVVIYYVPKELHEPRFSISIFVLSRAQRLISRHARIVLQNYGVQVLPCSDNDTHHTARLGFSRMALSSKVDFALRVIVRI